MRKLIARVALCLVGLGFVGCSSSSDSGSGDTCHDGCVATMAANCSDGPASQEKCESDCKALEASKCSSEFAAYQSCAAGKLITCNADGLPKVVPCASQDDAFVSCIIKP